MIKDILYKTVYAVCIAVFTVLSLSAQVQSVPNFNGKIIGTVIDGSTQQPIPYSTVALLRLSDSTITGGALCDDKGRFSVAINIAGSFAVKVSALGYAPLRVAPVLVLTTKPIVDMGNVVMKTQSNKIKEVTIQAQAETYKTEIDKKVFDVTQLATAKTGDATDVLQNVPSVTIDQNNNINLRGSANVTLLIDGKPSALLGSDPYTALQSIPASSIEKIEIITNPSAKYDASGDAGIINIILKKDKVRGFNMTYTGYVGNGEKYGGGVTANYRTSHFNLFGSFNYRDDTRYSKGYTTTYDSVGHNHINESYEKLQRPESYSSRAGIDYYIDKKNTLTLSGSGGWYNKVQTQNTNYYYTDNLNTIDSSYTRFEHTLSRNFSYDATLSYQGNWDKGRNLSASAQYSGNITHITSDYDNVYATDNYLPSTLAPLDETHTYPTTVNSFIAQIDYNQPLDTKSSIETGLKWTSRYINSTYNAVQTEADDNTVVLPQYTNAFTFNENVQAAYFSYSRDFSIFKLKAGVRAENTQQYFTGSNAAVKDSSFNKEYINLFPSMYLSHSFNKTTDVTLSYSRRINRPNYQQLNFIPNETDPLNVNVGNPALKPELTDAFELSYSTLTKIGWLNATVYDRYTNNLIQRYKTIDTMTNVTTTSFQNFAFSNSYGVEASLKMQPAKWSDILISGNFFGAHIDASNLQPGATDNSLGYSLRLLTTERVGYGFSGQLSGGYNQIPNPSFAEIKPFYNVDVAIKKEMLKGKLNFTLGITDIFNTQRFYININHIEGFNQVIYNKWESRVLTFSASWRFGKPLDNKDTRKNQQNGQQMPDVDY